jgi:hypothetical protein
VKARIWSHNRNKRPPRVVGDVQAASIPAARGIVSREKSAVRPFSIEFDLIGCDRPPVALTRYPLRVKLKLKGALKFLSLTKTDDEVARTVLGVEKANTSPKAEKGWAES